MLYSIIQDRVVDLLILKVAGETSMPHDKPEEQNLLVLVEMYLLAY